MALKKKCGRPPAVGGPEAVPTGKLRPCLGAGSGRALAGVGGRGCIPRELAGSLAGSWDSAVGGENAERSIQPLPTSVSALRGAGPPAHSVGGAPQPKGVKRTHQVTNLWALPAGARPF